MRRQGVKPLLTGEHALVAAGLLVLAAAVYGSHITQGGFHFDDWRYVKVTGETSHPFAAISEWNANDPHTRPLFGVGWWAVLKLTGENTALALLYATLVSVAAALALFGVLRSAGIDRLAAASAAVLFLVFPWADGLRLWATGAQAIVAVVLALLGAWVALHGVRREGRAWSLAAAALYAGALLQYEGAVSLVAAALVLPVLVAPWRDVLRFDVPALVLVAGALVWSAVSVPRLTQPDLAGTLDHAGLIAEQAWQLLGIALTPADAGGRVASVAAVAIVVASAFLWRRGRRDLTAGLALTATGAAIVFISYAMLAPAIDFYSPLTPGQGTRVNGAAGVGWVLLVTGLAVLLPRLVRPSQATPLTVAAVAAIAIPWTVQTLDDARTWQQGADLERRVLALAKATLGTVPPDSRVFYFGVPRGVRHEYPVFLESLDASTALQLTVRRDDVEATPVFENAAVVCADAGPRVSGGWVRPLHDDARYGSSFMLDLSAEQVLPVPDRAACEQLVARLPRGPIALYPG